LSKSIGTAQSKLDTTGGWACDGVLLGMDNKQLPYLVGIGASGSEGLTDIAGLLAKWPEHLNASALVVLHRPSDRASELCKVLQHSSRIPVEIAADGDTIQRGTCYVGEPAKILSIVGSGMVALLDGSDNYYRNRTIAILFESLAASAGEGAIGIVLSGSLADGSQGLAAIRAANGMTMVLDPGDKPRGMQQNAIDYDGPINFIGSATNILKVLGEICTPN
jgi:chemotaxis response regulator CheB